MGIELPTEFVTLARLAKATVIGLDPQWAGEKWVPDENLHVTVAFLGDVENAEMSRFVAGLQGLSVPRFDLSSPELVAVPNGRRAQMYWIELADESGYCAVLADQIMSIARESGITVEAERHRFRPHVTLVRSRRGRRAPQPAAGAFKTRAGVTAETAMSVPLVTVFTSTLAPTGPVYEKIAMIDLEAP